jgi:hypothetical protein
LCECVNGFLGSNCNIVPPTTISKTTTTSVTATITTTTTTTYSSTTPYSSTTTTVLDLSTNPEVATTKVGGDDVTNATIATDIAHARATSSTSTTTVAGAVTETFLSAKAEGNAVGTAPPDGGGADGNYPDSANGDSTSAVLKRKAGVGGNSTRSVVKHKSMSTAARAGLVCGLMLLFVAVAVVSVVFKRSHTVEAIRQRMLFGGGSVSTSRVTVNATYEAPGAMVTMSAPLHLCEAVERSVNSIVAIAGEQPYLIPVVGVVTDACHMQEQQCGYHRDNMAHCKGVVPAGTPIHFLFCAQHTCSIQGCVNPKKSSVSVCSNCAHEGKTVTCVDGYEAPMVGCNPSYSEGDGSRQSFLSMSQSAVLAGTNTVMARAEAPYYSVVGPAHAGQSGRATSLYADPVVANTDYVEGSGRRQTVWRQSGRDGSLVANAAYTHPHEPATYNSLGADHPAYTVVGAVREGANGVYAPLVGNSVYTGNTYTPLWNPNGGHKTYVGNVATVHAATGYASLWNGHSTYVHTNNGAGFPRHTIETTGTSRTTGALHPATNSDTSHRNTTSPFGRGRVKRGAVGGERNQKGADTETLSSFQRRGSVYDGFGHELDANGGSDVLSFAGASSGNRDEIGGDLDI